MPEFFSVVTSAAAWRILESHLQPVTGTEILKTSETASRITAESIQSPENLPAFPRSTMDGYALRASDTYGASEGFPAYLKVRGEVLMGCSSSLTVQRGEAVKIHTGGMLPNGADAVAMIENVQIVDASAIEVVRPTAPGENVLKIGDDIKKEELLLDKGHKIRSQDIGALMGLGITRLKVYRQPRISVISTGDEIISPELQPQPGQIRDINTYSISALIEKSGGRPIPLGIIPDDLTKLQMLLRTGLEQTDMVIISAGSSVSTRDMTYKAVESAGQPGVLVHGIAVRPGKPTIIGAANGKIIIGLPGNPVSTMVTFHLLARPAIYKLGGCLKVPAQPEVSARLTHNIPSTTGREDYVPVKLEIADGTLTATPIFGESNLITTLTKADGLAIVPLDLHGLKAGETVRVRMWE